MRLDESTTVIVDVRHREPPRRRSSASLHSRRCKFRDPSREGAESVQEDQLEAGPVRDIKFCSNPEHLSFTNIDKEFVVEAGDFEIMVGNSSRDQDLTKVKLTVI